MGRKRREILIDDMQFKLLYFLIQAPSATFSQIKKGLAVDHDETVGRLLRSSVSAGIIKKIINKEHVSYTIPQNGLESLLPLLSRASDSVIIGNNYKVVSHVGKSCRVYGLAPHLFPSPQENPRGQLSRVIHFPGTTIPVAHFSSKDYYPLNYEVHKSDLFPDGDSARLSDILMHLLKKLSEFKASERKKRAAGILNEYDYEFESNPALAKFVKKHKHILAGLLAEADNEYEINSYLKQPSSSFKSGTLSYFGIKSKIVHLHNGICGDFVVDLRDIEPDFSELGIVLARALSELKSKFPDLYPAGVSLVAHSGYDFVIPATSLKDAGKILNTWKRISNINQKNGKKK